MTDASSLEPRVLHGWVAWLRRTCGFCRPHAGFAAVLLFAACYLSPVVRSEFHDDDMPHAYVAGNLRVRDCSLVDLIGADIRHSIEQGRYCPAAPAIRAAVHFLLSDLLAYKCFLVALTLLNVFAFYCLLCCWKVDRRVAQLGALSLVLLFQLRLRPDAFSSFAGVTQIATAELLLSMICLQKHVASGRRNWQIGSVLLYAVALLTCEVGYLMLPVYLAISRLAPAVRQSMIGLTPAARRYRPAIGAAWPHVVTAVLLGALWLGLQTTNDRPLADLFRADVPTRLAARTALRHTAAALPLHYALIKEHRRAMFDARRVLSLPQNWFIGLAAGALTLILLRGLKTGPPLKPAAPLGLLFGAALTVWILPALPVSLLIDNRMSAQPRLAYLPVFVQYMGMALLVVWLLSCFRSKFPAQWPAFSRLLVVANACVALITFDVNQHVVNVASLSPAISGRRIIEAALDHGLGDEIPAGATLMMTKSHGWLCDGPPESSGFFAERLGRRVHVVNGRPLPRWRTLGQQLCGIPQPSFAVSDHTLDGCCGYVVLSRVDSTLDIQGEPRFGARSFRVFVQDRSAPPACGADRGAIIGESLAIDWDQRAPINAAQLTLLRRGPGWAIFAGHFAAPVSVASVHMHDAWPIARSTGNNKIR